LILPIPYTERFKVTIEGEGAEFLEVVETDDGMVAIAVKEGGRWNTGETTIKIEVPNTKTADGYTYGSYATITFEVEASDEGSALVSIQQQERLEKAETEAETEKEKEEEKEASSSETESLVLGGPITSSETTAPQGLTIDHHPHVLESSEDLLDDPSDRSSSAGIKQGNAAGAIENVIKSAAGEVESLTDALSLNVQKSQYDAAPSVYSDHRQIALEDEEELFSQKLSPRHKAALQAAKMKISKQNGKLALELDDTYGVTFVDAAVKSPKELILEEGSKKVAVKLNGKGEPNEQVEVDLEKHIQEMNEALKEKEGFSNKLNEADDFDKNLDTLVSQLDKLEKGSNS